MPIRNGYEGKRFAVLGDSISTLEGYTEPSDGVFYEGMQRFRAGVFVPADTWWGQVIAHLGGALLINQSISGSLVCKHPECTAPTYGCSAERIASLRRGEETPDVILVFLGINDWGWGLKPVPDGADDGEDPAVFSVAYGMMLEGLRTTYPHAELWCLTLPVSACRAWGAGDFPYRYGGRHIEEYNAVIRACADRMGARLVELYHPEAPHSTMDGFHPNADGMRTLADAVLGQVGDGG